jgi:hypothetical protein
MALPEWWTWDIELTAHSEERLQERGLTEIEIRTILDKPPRSVEPDPEPGRYRVLTAHRRQLWMVIVEPDVEVRAVVIISVFLAGEL